MSNAHGTWKQRGQAVWRKAMRRVAFAVVPCVRNGVRDERGLTSVEFAILLPVFAYLLMGILELSMMFFSTIVVDGAVQDAGRRLRTGQAESSGNTLTYFVNEVCDGVNGIYDCDEITFDVRTFENFSSASVPISVDEDGNYVTQFSAGGSGEITAVRAIYDWQFTTPFVADIFGNSEGKRTLTMTTVFRNEAY